MNITIILILLLNFVVSSKSYGSNKCSEIFYSKKSTQVLGEYHPQLVTLSKNSTRPHYIEINDLKIHEPFLKAPYPSTSIQYIFSNEALYPVYKDVLEKNTGGAYIGVGAEQNYTLAAFQKAEHLFLIDTNPLVAKIHQLNSVFFEISNSPHEFLDLYNKQNRENVIVWLKDKQLNDLAELYAELQVRLYDSYFNHTFKGTKIYEKPGSYTEKEGFKGESFLNDLSIFNYIKEMYKSQKVSIYLGDFSRTNLLEQVVNESRNLRLEVKSFYVSNSWDNMYISFNNPNFISGLTLLNQTSTDVLILNTYSESRRYFNSPMDIGALPQPVFKFQGEEFVLNWIYSVDKLKDMLFYIEAKEKKP